MSRSPLIKKSSIIFLLDENINQRVAPILREHHKVIFSPKGITDSQLVDFASENHAILITLDKDFTNSDRYKPNKNYGIIVLRVHPPTKEMLVNVLSDLLRNTPVSDFYGTITIVNQTGLVYIF